MGAKPYLSCHGKKQIENLLLIFIHESEFKMKFLFQANHTHHISFVAFRHTINNPHIRLLTDSVPCTLSVITARSPTFSSVQIDTQFQGCRFPLG